MADAADRSTVLIDELLSVIRGMLAARWNGSTPIRLVGVAAHQPGGQARGLRHTRRRQVLAATRRGPAAESGLVDGETPGNDGRRAGSGRALCRYDQRRAVDEPR